MKPKKERPAALPDSIFAARLGQDSDDRVPEDMPVHNTFIQFGAPPSAGDQKKPLLTAPAWIGPSFESIMHKATAETIALEAQAEPHAVGALPPEAAADSFFAPMEGNGEPFFQPEDEDGGQEVLPLGSPQKIPMRYAALSAASSNRAAGPSTASAHSPDGLQGLPDWSPSAVATVGTPVTNFAGVVDGFGNREADAAQSSRAAVIPSPPLDGVPLGPLPSMGSAQHAEGACKRCCFFPKGRCQNGYNCEFCHFEHEKRKRKKKKKSAARKDTQGLDDSEDSSEDEPVPGGGPGTWDGTPHPQHASSTRPGGRPGRGDERGGGVRQPDPIGPMRAGLPLTAPPLLPPRGLPPGMPAEPPPPAPTQGMQGFDAVGVGAASLNAAADPFYASGRDLPGLGLPGLGAPGVGIADPFYGSGYDPTGAGGPYAPLGGYGGAAYGDGRLGLGGVGINQSYFGGGYDPAAIAAQQQQAAYQQQPSGRYLPPPR